MPLVMPRPDPVPSAKRPTGSVVFKDADDLWDTFERYKHWCRTDGVREVGSKGRRVPTPMTPHGMAAFCGCGHQTVMRAAKRPDLAETWETISADIFAELIGGGLLKQYDPQIVARVTGLSERSVVETVEPPAAPEYDYSRLTTEELATLTELLDRCKIDG